MMPSIPPVVLRTLAALLAWYHRAADRMGRFRRAHASIETVSVLAHEAAGDLDRYEGLRREPRPEGEDPAEAPEHTWEGEGGAPASEP
jgi:hypothetical protein